MIRVITRCGLSAVLLFVIAAPASAATIDSFNDSASVEANSGLTSDSDFTASGAFLGTNRELQANWLSGSNSVGGEIDAAGNSLLNINLGAGTIGDLTVIWNNIGGIDITEGATLNAISLDIVFDDLPTDITILLFDGVFLGHSTTTTAGGIFAPTTESLFFSSFSGTVDFTSIEMIALIIEPLFGGADLEIGFIETANVIPEPATALLFSFGLVALGMRRRKA